MDEISNTTMIREIAEEFAIAASNIENVIYSINSLTGVIADGALVGRTGDAIYEAINSDFNASTSRLVDKIKEVSHDLTQAAAAIDKDDGISSQLFRG